MVMSHLLLPLELLLTLSLTLCSLFVCLALPEHLFVVIWPGRVILILQVRHETVQRCWRRPSGRAVCVQT